MDRRGHLIRLGVGVGAGAVTGVALAVPSALPVGTLMGVILGIDTGAAAYLGMVWFHLLKAGEALSAAADEDEGHLGITGLVLLAAVSGMTSIFFLSKRSHHDAAHAIATAATIIISWLLVQTVFALHYANRYRLGANENVERPGLDFPGKGPITFLDFIYVAFTVGLTFQVSDVTTTTPGMRRIVTAHSVVAFVFNTAIIALAVGAATQWL